MPGPLEVAATHGMAGCSAEADRIETEVVGMARRPTTPGDGTRKRQLLAQMDAWRALACLADEYEWYGEVTSARPIIDLKQHVESIRKGDGPFIVVGDEDA